MSVKKKSAFPQTIAERPKDMEPNILRKLQPHQNQHISYRYCLIFFHECSRLTNSANLPSLWQLWFPTGYWYGTGILGSNFVPPLIYIECSTGLLCCYGLLWIHTSQTILNILTPRSEFACTVSNPILQIPIMSSKHFCRESTIVNHRRRMLGQSAVVAFESASAFRSSTASCSEARDVYKDLN